MHSCSFAIIEPRHSHCSVVHLSPELNKTKKKHVTEIKKNNLLYFQLAEERSPTIPVSDIF
jgi:hypothetical protein